LFLLLLRIEISTNAEMTKLKQKSGFNFDAAEILIKSNYYAPSVHCSYYSCFQLMKFALKDFCGIEYKDLEKKIADDKQQTTHVFVINELGKVFLKFDKLIYREFNSKIKDLKTFRIDSDYKDIEIISDQGEKAFKLAGEIRTLLIENLNL